MTMEGSTAAVLAELLGQAGLPEAERVERISWRGFDNEVWVVEVDWGPRVVLRRWREVRVPEVARARFLEGHRVPAPRLLAAGAEGSLYAGVAAGAAGVRGAAGEHVERLRGLV